MKLLDLPRQYRDMRAEIDSALQSTLDSGRYIGGPAVKAFERDFAAYVGVNHCVGVGSGTDALRIALEAAGIKGQVIVPANTAFPTTEAVICAGARPVFCDCQPDTYTMSPEHLLSLVGPKTEAVIPVHLYGQACDMNTIASIAARYGLFVLEDCAHAHGARYHGQMVGSLGDAAAFSFNPVKILGALGDAGGITTDDESLAQRCRSLRDHGRREKYIHQRLGYNSRLDAVNAGVLIAKLKHLDDWVEHRNRVASWYRERLQDVVELPTVASRTTRHAYHQYVVRVPDRDQVRQILTAMYEIETGIHYPLVLSEQPALRFLNARPEDTPMATAYAQQILSLPMNESIQRDDVALVCAALEALVNKDEKSE